MKQVQDAYIVAATRTPIGKSHKGYLRNMRPDDLLATTMKAVLAQAPGLDPQAIEVQMDRGLLTIKGERREEKVDETERYSRIERRHGVFHRRFALPDSADPDGITASGHNGVLTISIPKRPESTPRRIQVGSVFNS